MIKYSTPSSLISWPAYLPNRMVSPTLTSSGTRLPSSLDLAEAGREHGALLWFFLRGIRNDDRARALLGFLEALNDDAVVERSDIHDCELQTGVRDGSDSNVRRTSGLEQFEGSARAGRFLVTVHSDSGPKLGRRRTPKGGSRFAGGLAQSWKNSFTKYTHAALERGVHNCTPRAAHGQFDVRAETLLRAQFPAQADIERPAVLRDDILPVRRRRPGRGWTLKRFCKAADQFELTVPPGRAA